MRDKRLASGAGDDELLTGAPACGAKGLRFAPARERVEITQCSGSTVDLLARLFGS